MQYTYWIWASYCIEVEHPVRMITNISFSFLELFFCGLLVLRRSFQFSSEPNSVLLLFLESFISIALSLTSSVEPFISLFHIDLPIPIHTHFSLKSHCSIQTSVPLFFFSFVLFIVAVEKLNQILWFPLNSFLRFVKIAFL